MRITTKKTALFLVLVFALGVPVGADEVSQPDTPDLQGRAKLALSFLTKSCDPQRGGLPLWWGKFNLEQPALWHENHIYMQTAGLWTDAVVLMRHMTGDTHHAELQAKLGNLLLSYYDPEDGFVHQEKREDQPVQDNVPIQSMSYSLKGMVTLYAATKDQRVKAYIDRLIGGLSKIMIKKDDYWYFPSLGYSRSSGWSSQEEPPVEGWPLGAAGHCIFYLRPLSRYAHLTGDPTARELADNMFNWILFHSGTRFGIDKPIQGILVTNTWAANAALYHAHWTGRQDLKDWAIQAFQVAQKKGTRFGWFPEFDSNYVCEGGETCPLVDMIEIAITLALAGQNEYWDVAEKYGRNQLLEHQMLHTDWFENIRPIAERRPGNSPPGGRTENVLEMLPGGFAGWSAPNDFFGCSSVNANFMKQGCCVVQGARGLYLLWHHAIRELENGVWIDLLFSRSSRSVDVHSHLPYEGQVDLHVHLPQPMYVRIPGHVDRTQVSVKINGQTQPVEWQKGYVHLKHLTPDARVEITFPLAISKTREIAQRSGFQVVWKGNTVVSIDPPGAVYPLYARQGFLSGPAPRTTRSAYVPEKSLKP